MDIFEELGKKIENDQEKAQILEALKKTEGGRKFLQDLATDATSYRTWYTQEYPKEKEKLTAAESELQRLRTEMERKTPVVTVTPTTPVKLDFDDMTDEKFNQVVDARIKAGGFVSRQDAEAIADAKAAAQTAAVTAQLYGKGLPMVEQMLAFKNQYEKDFGKPMDRAAFGTFVDQGKFSTLAEAYKSFTSEDYLNKVKAEAFTQGEAKGAKDTEARLRDEATKAAVSGIPVDMGGSNAFGPGRFLEGAKPADAAPELAGIPDNYDIRKGGGRLAHEVAKIAARDKAAGKVL